MTWEKLKRAFGRQEDGGKPAPDIRWVEAADNPWGVRLLDVRPVTLTMLSTSGDPQCASNAVSFGQEDGTTFIGEAPPVARVVEANLRFPIDRLLADGVLFAPREMEHKWALFFHRGEIICVRSWLRRVHAVARVEQRQDHLAITQVRGTFGAEDEEPALTTRTLDYLLRSHALDTAYPAPIPAGMENDPKAAAMWCMSMFGNRASFATPHRFDRRDPERPLRSQSLLHIAVARGDARAIDDSLAAGMPIDLLAGDGLAPLHWAVGCDDVGIAALLVDRGSPVDVRSSKGATPLMNAVQSASVEKARLLIDRGALPNPEAEGHTPRSLAEKRGHRDVVAVLESHGAAPA